MLKCLVFDSIFDGKSEPIRIAIDDDHVRGAGHNIVDAVDPRRPNIGVADLKKGSD
jgi:hypothetical protein